MSPRPFDRIMLDVEAGGNAKLGRLTDAEFRCHITGVLPLAAKSPIRGRLLVGEHKAEAGDVARQARMSVTVARRTIGKLRDLGVIERDEELGCEMVHDFEDWNPAPKKDRTNADRQARYRLRMTERYDASRNGVTNAPVTPTKGREVEGKGIPPSPPRGGRARTQQTWKDDVIAWAGTVGVTEPAEPAGANILKAYKTSKAWEQDDPAGAFRAVASRFYSPPLIVGLVAVANA